MSISKTDFMRGMQCPKMLWLDAHKPEQKRIDMDTQHRLDKGNEFGDKAMGMFGAFTAVTEYIPNTKYLDKKKMLTRTRHEIAAGTENICEASFEFNGFFCAVDILHKVDENVWEMYEVKDSPEVKEQYIMDASYQAWVLDKCGIQLDGVYVVYHYDDDIDPFEPVDITEQAIELYDTIEQNVYRLNEVKQSKIEIAAPRGEQCNMPYECWYKEYCSKCHDSD